jgi:hypothetical protein
MRDRRLTVYSAYACTEPNRTGGSTGRSASNIELPTYQSRDCRRGPPICSGPLINGASG